MGIVLKKIKPLGSSVITTMDKYPEAQIKDGLIDNSKDSGSLKELQKVIAVGEFVRNIEVGDTVCVNPSRFAIMKHKAGSVKDNYMEDNVVKDYNFPVIVIDGKDHLMITDRDIDFVVEEFTEE